MRCSELTYISLFSSAGVGCYGFSEAGFKCIATNELIKRRLDIQRYNQKCERESGYISGDIALQETKDAIFREVNWWKENKGIQDVTAVIATPPCQGMSVFNHKRNDNDIIRNSLVIESLKIVKQLHPLFLCLKMSRHLWIQNVESITIIEFQLEKHIIRYSKMIICSTMIL